MFMDHTTGPPGALEHDDEAVATTTCADDPAHPPPPRPAAVKRKTKKRRRPRRVAPATVSVARFREEVRALFGAIFKTHGASDAHRAVLAAATEMGLFAARPLREACAPAEVRQSLYFHAAAQLLSNLDPDSYVQNKHLVRKVIGGEVAAGDLATMTPQELFPERWAKQMARLALERQQENREPVTSDQFLCSRCNRRECTYYQLQTRSADEPITTFVRCQHCHNRWRE